MSMLHTTGHTFFHAYTESNSIKVSGLEVFWYLTHYKALAI
jgi:hypothetical protein